MRLLDVGCGWGGMVLHAAQHHGVRAVGVTLSQRQAELAAKRVAEAGLTDRVEIRLQDYRDVDDGPFDAISSIGMFEHVGLRAARRVLRPAATSSCAPGGRLLNHAHQPPARRRAARPRGRRGSPGAASSTATCSPTASCTRSAPSCRAMQRAGFEARHMESLREHYALDAAGVGRATSRRTGTRPSAEAGAGPGADLAPLHGRVGGRTSRRTATPRCTRCSRRSRTAAAAACRSAPASSSATGATPAGIAPAATRGPAPRPAARRA